MNAPACDPEVAAEFLRALAHPMRLRILCRLLEGELSVAGFESELGLKQPNLSQQLAALREAGLVATRRESKSIVYSLTDARVAEVLEALRVAFSAGAPGVSIPCPPAQPAPLAVTTAPPRPAKHQPSGEAGVFAIAGWEMPPPRGRRG